MVQFSYLPKPRVKLFTSRWRHCFFFVFSQGMVIVYGVTSTTFLHPSYLPYPHASMTLYLKNWQFCTTMSCRPWSCFVLVFHKQMAPLFFTDADDDTIYISSQKLIFFGRLFIHSDNFSPSRWRTHIYQVGNYPDI